MFIDLASVGRSAKPLKAEFRQDEIDLELEGDLADPAKFRGEIFTDDIGVHVEGMITADVVGSCTRCLEPLTRRFEIAFKDVFVDAANESIDRETEIAVSDLDQSLVIGGRVELAEVVREQILLAMPEQILCGEDCMGLCPKCGGNRNLVVCNCDREEIDPRWAGLEDLKS